MLDGEVYVLQAVRDTLRISLGLTEHQCECEQDEKIPAIAGDIYVAVIPAGPAFGPTNNTSGGVIDSLYSVKVTVFCRCTPIAKDRQRVFLLDEMKGVNALLSKVIYAISWQMNVMTLTNHLLWKDFPNSEPFIEMLRASSIDASTRIVNSDTYSAVQGKNGFVARARSVVFSGCRRIQTVNQSN